jgi:3-phenylpropionate/cinnamic acid dioxygenase small subunit
MLETAQRDLILHHQVSQFIFREARLQDEHDYEAWEALWTDDAIYWVPANGEASDPELEMSIIYDNRSRIALRVRQLLTGRRYAQEPRSQLRRVVSNIEASETVNGEIEAAANALVFESSVRGETLWACRCKYLLRRDGAGFRMARKTVILPNNDKALYTLAFLI